MVESTSLVDYLKYGFEVIWQGLKLAASWCWEQLKSGWKLACDQVYELLSGWATRLDESILQLCKKKGRSKD